MTKALRPFILIIGCILLGIFIYHQWGTTGLAEKQSGDTSLVQRAVAQQMMTDSSNQLMDSRRNAITRAVELVSPAVISVNVTKINEYIQRNPYSADPFFREFFPEMFGDRVFREQVQSIGSGFIISDDGYVLTNEHVVGNAEEIIVAMHDGTEVPAKLIGQDHTSDIALLKIDKKNLPYIRLGDSDKVLIGEWAIALGNPFGLFVKSNPTVTVGVISAVDRDFSPLEGRVYEDMIQTDAAINNGNSGGPLCNAVGEVIGMNTFIFTGDSRSSGSVGVGFAIPSNRVKRLVEELKKKKDQRGDPNIWVGMYVSNLNRYLARMLGYSSLRGVYVKRIDRRSPAEKAGIQLGDIIIGINGYPINDFSDAEQVIISANLHVGDKLRLQVWREGREFDTTIHLERSPN